MAFPKKPPAIRIDLTQVSKSAAAASRAATKAGSAAKIRRLSKSDMRNMTKEQIKAYYKQEHKNARSDMRNLRKSQRQARRDIKAGQAAELAVHQTIRQGIAELAGIGAEGVGTYAISKGSPSANAITQNVSGGMTEHESEEERDPGNGPVASKYGRKED